MVRSWIIALGAVGCFLLCAAIAGAPAQAGTAEVETSGIGTELQGTVAASLPGAAAAQNMAAFARAEKIGFAVLLVSFSAAFAGAARGSRSRPRPPRLRAEPLARTTVAKETYGEVPQLAAN